MKKAKARTHKGSISGSKKDSSQTALTAVDDSLQSPTEFVPGIPDLKWQDLADQEERDLMILQIREDVFSNCLEITYNKYLKRQAVKFAVHCSYIAWKKILNCYFLKHEPVELTDDCTPLWAPDSEIAPSTIDTWASFSIPLIEKPIESIPTRPFSMRSLISEATLSEGDTEEEELQRQLAELKSRQELTYQQSPAISVLNFDQTLENETTLGEKLELSWAKNLEKLFPKKRVQKFHPMQLEHRMRKKIEKSPSKPSVYLCHSQRILAQMDHVPAPSHIMLIPNLPPERVELTYTVVQPERTESNPKHHSNTLLPGIPSSVSWGEVRSALP